MPLERHAFWDRSNAGGGSTLDPSAYHDPSEETLQASHTTMAAALPPAIMGARGTIVRGSTLGGAPIGWDPHGVATRVNIDPETGQGFTVDLSKMTEAASLAAVEEAGIRGAQSVEDLRFRAASAMLKFAVYDQPVQQARYDTTQQRFAPINMPGVYVVPESTLGGLQIHPQQQAPIISQGIQTTHAEIHPTQNQMAKHNIPGFAPDNAPVPVPQQPLVPDQAPPAYPVHRNEVAQAATVPASLFASMAKQNKKVTPIANNFAAGAPTYKVTLEIKDFPTSIEAWYHDVVRNEQVLSLVYDTRAVGFPRTRLRPQPEDIALRVEGAQMFYICTDPGISFTYPEGGNEYQIFLIKSEHPYQEPEVAQQGLML